ncbi:MAG: L,D-transpeptidase family protein [Tannerella sp.]|jgi:murein L,D-transpeptidase YafK|nr:L,D-transpeptidase family protein [Tannerella sp.]
MKNIIIILVTANCCNSAFAQDFLSQQRKFAGVRTALSEKEQMIADNLQKHGLSVDAVNILITIYKAEKQLEIYAKKKNENVYIRIAIYNICALSGKLGPKRKQGDRQVPEGFYHIDRFNPASNFYLSLGINYPNPSDKIKSAVQHPGGDIFIHGSCATIGCLPMTDDKIKEIYLYAVYARNNGQKNISVYLFPFRMTDINFDGYKNQHAKNQELIDFWTNLKIGYNEFVSEHKALNVAVDTKGNYLFK